MNIVEELPKTILMVVIFLLSTTVFAQELELFKSTIFYHGDVDFELKASYSAGEIINTNITINNLESFPIFDGYLVIQIIEGCKEPVYPTSKAECNVVHEEKIEGIDLMPWSEKIVKWSYKLPEDIKSGDYKVSVYFKTKGTPIVGIPASFFEQVYKNFTLTNGKDFPKAKISWTKTHVAGGYAQSGPGVLPGSEVEGVVFLKAIKEFKGNLNVKICSYDDTACDSYLIEKSYSVKLAEGEEKPLIISFIAPSKPDAYAIRFELVDENGRLNSLYRSRIVVLGEGARILKLAISKPYYKAGETGWIRVLATGPLMYSPILPSVSEVKNVKLNVYLTHNGKEIFKDFKVIPILRTDELTVNEFSFTLHENVDKINVCAELSNDIIYDKYCYTTTFEMPTVEKQKIIPSFYFNIILLSIIILIIVGIFLYLWRRRK